MYRVGLEKNSFLNTLRAFYIPYLEKFLNPGLAETVLLSTAASILATGRMGEVRYLQENITFVYIHVSYSNYLI